LIVDNKKRKIKACRTCREEEEKGKGRSNRKSQKKKGGVRETGPDG